MQDPDDHTAPVELTIGVNGAEDTYEATADANADGTNDSVYVETDDGGYVYTDTDGDGVADTLTEFATGGDVSAQAVHVAGSGEWQAVAPGSVDITAATTPETAPETAPEITVDTEDGPASAGPAAFDTDGDGVADTAVAATTDGATLVVTDSDGDGSADVLTEVAPDGDFTSYEHTGDGEWTVVDSGNLADDARAAAPTTTATATTDPATGEWVRH